MLPTTRALSLCQFNKDYLMPRQVAVLGCGPHLGDCWAFVGGQDCCQISSLTPFTELRSRGLYQPKTSKENADGKGCRWSHPQPLRPMPPTNISPQGLEQQEIYYRIMPLLTQNASLQDKQQDLNNNSNRNLLIHPFPARIGRNINAA